MNNKKVHITFDYELFFGSSTGSIDKCLIEPTEILIQIAEAKQVKFVFFIDAGFVWALHKNLHFAKCAADYKRVAEQIKKLNEKGHEIALHIHPHWEDSDFENDQWKINTNRYKIANFSQQEVELMVDKYHQALSQITGKPCKSFRAGGWCIQPFSNIKKALIKNNIFIDSSVYKNGYHQFSAQSYDFRNAPNKTTWKFEEEECVEVMNGTFTEVAITPDFLPPTFYYALYLKMKVNPANYKPIGDGSWLKDKKKIYKQFYSFTNHFACCDGYFASRLKSILLNLERDDKFQMLVLGHPKSMAKCSFKYLEEFINFSKQKGYSIESLT